jgi:hypothetical protein
MSRSGRTRLAPIPIAWLLLGMTALAGTTALAACSRSETPGGAKAEGRVPGGGRRRSAGDRPRRPRAGAGHRQTCRRRRRRPCSPRIGGEIHQDPLSRRDRTSRTGDLLFTIDPRTSGRAPAGARPARRPAQAQITQAEANLARAQGVAARQCRGPRRIATAASGRRRHDRPRAVRPDPHERAEPGRHHQGRPGGG